MLLTALNPEHSPVARGGMTGTACMGGSLIMAETVASTAHGVMLLIALEQTLPSERRIIDDPLAYQLLPSNMKLMVKVCNLKPVRRGFFNLLEKRWPGAAAGFVCRKRYVEDKVREALKTGIDSAVMLGTGLDTLAYRVPELSTVLVYELDLPANITYKTKKLEAVYGPVPSYVTLVPIDFEDQNLESVLTQRGYSFAQRAFFVWEGVTQYLTEAAVRSTFQFLAKAKPGSRLIFSYVLKDFINGQNMYGVDSYYQQYRVENPIWQFGLDPRDVASFIGEYSWNVLEQVGSAELSERYLKPAGREAAIPVIERVVYAEKV